MFRTFRLMMALAVLLGVVAASPVLAWEQADYEQRAEQATHDSQQREAQREAMVEQGQAQVRQTDQAYRDSLRPRFDPRAYSDPVPAYRYQEFKPNYGDCSNVPGIGRRC